jgi:hypothetical protein|tara:strand:- start:185 stop:1072 length:888 start_codon:yes stop_codon:yes gene_type:complete
MLPDNFDFAQLPDDRTDFTLQEVGMLASRIEDIDYAITSWLKEDLDLSTITNEGYKRVPVLWQTPERAFQVKNNHDLRHPVDDGGGVITLPVVTIERTGIIKDPTRKGGYQAQIFSNQRNGRVGRMTIAKRIKQDKTRNFAVVGNTRTNTSGDRQKYFPRVNKKVVIETLSIPIPIYVNLDYKIIVKTEYQQQMNDLTQPFMTRTGQINSFVMRRNGHLYEAFIDQGFTQSNNVANLGEDERQFTSEVKIRVLGYLIGEGNSDDRPIVTKEESVVEITFPRETVLPAGNDNFLMD